jgi:hypothetical protein
MVRFVVGVERKIIVAFHSDQLADQRGDHQYKDSGENFEHGTIPSRLDWCSAQYANQAKSQVFHVLLFHEITFMKVFS